MRINKGIILGGIEMRSKILNVLAWVLFVTACLVPVWWIVSEYYGGVLTTHIGTLKSLEQPNGEQAARIRLHEIEAAQRKCLASGKPCNDLPSMIQKGVWGAGDPWETKGYMVSMQCISDRCELRATRVDGFAGKFDYLVVVNYNGESFISQGHQGMQPGPLNERSPFSSMNPSPSLKSRIGPTTEKIAQSPSK
jgi:hypothetical protein